MCEGITRVAPCWQYKGHNVFAECNLGKKLLSFFSYPTLPAFICGMNFPGDTESRKRGQTLTAPTEQPTEMSFNPISTQAMLQIRAILLLPQDHLSHLCKASALLQLLAAG